MVKAQPLSRYALRVLAEIHVTGIYVWVRGTVVLLNDPQRSRVRFDTVEALLHHGLLVEDPVERELSVTDAGRALLERNKEAVGRARGIHEAQQLIIQATGKTPSRPNSTSTVRP